jgi:hypothetical protein
MCKRASSAKVLTCIWRCNRQVEKQRDKLPQTRAKGEDEMNNTIKTLQHKENKLAGTPECPP